MPVPPKDKWRSQRGTLRGGTRQGRGTEGREKEGSAPLVTGLALDLGSARCYCLRSVWESREVLEVRWDGMGWDKREIDEEGYLDQIRTPS